MKIIITGAAGAIGSHLAERLVEEGHDVTGVDALTDYYNPKIKEATAKEIESKGVKMQYKNLVDDDLEETLKDAEVIFHLAAQPGISATTPFNDYLKNNFIATQKLLDTALKNEKLEAFINASTSSIYGAFANGPEHSIPEPTSNYGVTKLAAEQLALSYYRSQNMPVINLRFFSVYGERERPEKFFYKLIKAMYEDKEITVFEGSENHIRSYSYVGDIINGCVNVLAKKAELIGETFNLGNDKTNTTGEGIKYIEEIMGKKAKIVTLPKRLGDQIETGAKIDKARFDFGYNPTTDLKTGLQKEVEWYGEKVHGKF